MPLSRCFFTARNIAHTAYWEFAGPYILIWTLLSAVSTAILYYSGSVRLGRLFPWIAKWKCFKGCYSTPLMELLSWVLFFLISSPGITQIVLGVATYYWDFSYDGVHSDGAAASFDTKFIGQYDHCTMLGVITFTVMFAFDFLRLGMFMWCFRHWIMQRTTSLFIGVASFFMLLFTFLLSTTAENYDDVMTCAPFLTLSALLLLRVVYNYFDDLGIDLNDYLYHDEISEDSIHCKGHSTRPREERWSGAMYICHCLGNLACLFCYAFAGYWIDTRSSSPMYVYPWIQAVDLAVAFGLHNAKARHFGEVLMAFIGVVGFRIIVIYLGMQDRSHAKPGAWEFVQPVFFLLASVIGSSAVADSFWRITKNDTSEIVLDDRYSQWITLERQAVVKQRNAGLHGAMTSRRTGLFAIGQLIGFTSDVSARSACDQAEVIIKNETLDMLNRKAIEIGYEKERDFKQFYIDRDPYYEPMNKAGKTEPRKDAEGNTVRVGEPMSEADLELTIRRMAEHREVREIITTKVRLMTLKKFFISYKYILLLTIIHVSYSLFFWFKTDPIERKIWPFSQTIRGTNFAWLAIVIGVAAFIWTFVYGAMSNLVINREEIDYERHSVRELLLTTSSNDYQVTATKADIKHPRALSWHHHKSRERHKNGKCLKESVDLAMKENVEKGRGMLTSEMPKIAAEAAALYTLREWTTVLREWKNKATGIEDLIDFVHGPAFNETFIQSRDPPVDQAIETTFAANYNDATHQASEQDAEQDREEAEKIFKARAFAETIAQVAQLAVISISKTARTAAEENGGSIKQQIGAAIMASALAHSYFQAAGHGHSLESSKALCRSVALQAARDMDYKMEPQQLIDAWSEHSFMGLDRLAEIKKIGSSETRWPPIGGLNRNKIRDIFKFKEVIWQSGCGAITGASLGLILSAFLAIVLAYDTGDNTSWLGLNTKGNTRTLLISIFFPYVVIPIAIVVQSWKRNKYHFWCESEGDITITQRLKQWRTMRRRDKANVRGSCLGCMMMLGWSTTTGVFVNVEEAFTVLAALIAVLTTVIPVLRATQHKRALSFLSDMFVFGFLVVVVLLVTYFFIRDDWVVPALFFLYYTLVCCFLTYYRGYMNGWMEHNILASIDKNVIFPFVGFLACLYLRYNANTNDSPDAKGYFVLGMLCISVVLAALVYFFSLALRINQKIQDHDKKSTARIKLSMKYLELDNVDLSRKQKQKQASTLNRQFKDGDRKAMKRNNSFGFDGTDDELLVREEEKTPSWLSEHIHEVTMFILYILVLSAGLLAVGYYAKDKDTTYSSEHRVMYFSSVFLGLHYVIFTGLSFVLDRGTADGWHFSPSTVFPVIIPLQGDQGFDFKKGVISFNKPTACWYLGLMCIGFWGILACIMPDVDFLFGDDQMIVGVLAICVCLLGTACGPFLGALRMNFALANNYHHIAARAVCMTPVTDVDRIVKTCVVAYCKKSEVFKDMDPEDCEFTAEDMHTIATDSFCRCFSNDFDGNDWVAPKKYFNGNKDYKIGDVWSHDKFGEALDLLFPNMEPENEGEPKKYHLQQFFLFFRAHCLQYGTLKWDNSFLTEKRDWAIKELKTCRALYTMQADSLSKSTQHKFYTPSQVASHLTDALYPAALSTIFPCGGCTFPDSDAHPLYGSHNRRDLYSTIFDNEKYNVYLLLEKIHFEGHFALAVGYSAACMTSIDLMTNLALRANATKLTMIDDTDNQENQEGYTQVNNFELPLQNFSRDIAATVYDTRIPPGKKDAKPFRCPKGGMRHVSHSIVRLRKTEYEKSLNAILTQVMRDGVAAGIGDYYSCTRLLFEFFARASTPAGMKVKYDLRPSGLGDLTIIDQQNWEAIFDNLTPTSSLYDLYIKTETLHAKWKMLCDPTSLKLEGDPKEQGGCFDSLESPIVYAASLFLEYYDVAMFVGIYSSGSTRYGIFKQACENSQTFRLYVERMCEEAKKDPICKDSTKGLAFTQVIQSSQKIMDSLEQGCEIIFGPHGNYVLRDENNQVVFSPAGRYTDGEFDAGKIHPDMGPAVLREASMLLQARAVYEVAFKCITSTQTNSSPLDCQGYPDTTISYQDIMQWSKCIRGHHIARCAEDNIIGSHTKRWDDRFGSIKKDQTFSCEEFVQLHPKVSDGINFKLGDLCVESRHWLQFEDLLDDIKAVCIKQIMELKQCSKDSATDKFDRSCTQTQNYDLVQWFSRWTATVDNMFESCFYFKNTSYLRHYNQTKNAVKEKVLGIEFERYQEELRRMLLDGTFTNIPADGSGKVEFQWKEGSIMDRANKLKLLYRGHQYLADLCCLFMATQEVRRDWSALYRVWRTIAMSRHDADIASQVAGAEADEKQSIRRHLGGVLGNDDSEENQVYLSTQRFYSNIADPSALSGVPAQLVSTDVCLHHQQEDKKGKKQTCQECAAANRSRCRGFLLLDRSSPFVRIIDPEQARSDDEQKLAWKAPDVRWSTGVAMNAAASDIPEPDISEDETVQIPVKESKKADLWVLDTMLVVTTKRQVNFNATDTKQQDTAVLSTSSTDLGCVGKDDLNDEDRSHEEAIKNVVQVSVMLASINLPIEDVTHFPPKEEAWPFVIKVTGDRFVASEKRRRFYYLATFDQTDHKKLYSILRSKMRVLPLDTYRKAEQGPSSPRREANQLMESPIRRSSAEGIPEGSGAEGIPDVEVVQQWHDDEVGVGVPSKGANDAQIADWFRGQPTAQL